MYGRRLGSILLVGVVACTGQPAEEPQAEGPTAADSVVMAEEQFEEAGFDTIQWDAPEEAVVRGSVVFSYSCARCHGGQGFGDGGFVTQGDTLRPPSFHEVDWAYADDVVALRKLVYTGSENGMPHYGLAGLKYRDIDAVARFIMESSSRLERTP